MYKKVKDKLNSNDELSTIIEKYIKMKGVINKIETIEKETIRKVVDIIKEGKEGKGEDV